VALATLTAAGVAWVTKGRRVWTVTHTLVLVFGGWVALTGLMARDPHVAQPWMVEYGKIFLMFAASALLIWNAQQVWMLFCMAALVLGYIAYEINYLYLMNGFLRIQSEGYGGFDNNVAALMLAMGVPLCYFAWEGGRSRWRWLFLLLIPCLLHAVLMTYSRGAMVALLVAAPLAGWRSRHRSRFAMMGLAVALMLPVLAGPEIRSRFFSIQEHEQDDSANERRHSWGAGWAIACANPVFGVGVRNANLFSFEHGAAFPGQTIHSQYLQIAADNGFVGLGLYLTCLGAVALDLQRVRRQIAWRKDPDAVRTRSLVAGIECSLVVFCVGGIFLSLEVFELPYLLLLLGAQLGPLAHCASMRSHKIIKHVPVAMPASS
jgi:probable O-glycosylation ligase (exosortase A-associated)